MVLADLRTRAGLAYLHYVILLPPLEVCLERVQNRADHGFGDLSVTGDLYEQFAGTDVDRRHVINESDDHPAKVAELISGGLESGRFRYSSG